MNTKEKILLTTQKIFSRKGPDGISIRVIAEQLRIVPSVIYHYFASKDTLIKQMYAVTWQELKKESEQLPLSEDLATNFKTYLHFSFDHAQEHIATLKYFYHYRLLFKKYTFGYLPSKYFAHLEKILKHAIQQKQLKNFDAETVARQIGHLYYGYLQEYFPSKVTDEQRKVLFEMLSNIALQILEPYRE